MLRKLAASVGYEEGYLDYKPRIKKTLLSILKTLTLKCRFLSPGYPEYCKDGISTVVRNFVTIFLWYIFMLQPHL